MIVRFFHADSDVKAALARAVRSMPKVLLITQLKGSRTLAVESKTPFKEILASAGDWLDLVVVIDEGRPEGMWRDPMGELCDRLLPDSKEAAAATSGYLLTRGGRALAWFGKALWEPLEDAEEITAYLAQLIPGLQPYQRAEEKTEPRPARRVPRRRDTPIINPATGRLERADTDEIPIAAPPEDDDKTPVPPPPATPPPEPPPIDPYAVLGVTPGVSLDEAKKAWRGLLLQYHPDKVAHLAPEFQALAEEKTRALNAAFAMIEEALQKAS